MDTTTNAECKPIVEDDRTGLSVETLKRAFLEYCEKIWNAKPVKVELENYV